MIVELLWYVQNFVAILWSGKEYRQISNIWRSLVGDKLVNHSDVVGASPVATAPTTSSFLT